MMVPMVIEVVAQKFFREVMVVAMKFDMLSLW